MRNFLLSLVIIVCSTAQIYGQKSKKGFEYSGTKARYSMLGKSRMFSEGVKPVDYTIFWNRKKNTISVQAGAKENWYEIQLLQVDTIHGHVTHLGSLKGLPKNASAEEKEKSEVEVRFLMDKVTIKKGGVKLEEYLLDGALVWEDNKVNSN